MALAITVINQQETPMNLIEDCSELKKHLVHLFGDGAAALAQVIVDQQLGGITEPSYIILERITFSREFIAVDFEYQDKPQQTVYLPIEDVQKACYPEPTEIDPDKLKDDFAKWSGGFRPEDEYQIAAYLDHTLDKNLDRDRAKFILEDWITRP